jgi:hypothetical protein
MVGPNGSVAKTGLSPEADPLGGQVTEIRQLTGRESPSKFSAARNHVRIDGFKIGRK